MIDDRIIEKGYFCIDNEVQDNLDLSFAAKVVYAEIVRWGWKDGWEFSETKFAKATRKGRVTIHKAVIELVKSGLISIEGKDSQGRNKLRICKVNKYQKQPSSPKYAIPGIESRPVSDKTGIDSRPVSDKTGLEPRHPPVLSQDTPQYRAKTAPCIEPRPQSNTKYKVQKYRENKIKSQASLTQEHSPPVQGLILENEDVIPHTTVSDEVRAGGYEVFDFEKMLRDEMRRRIAS